MKEEEERIKQEEEEKRKKEELKDVDTVIEYINRAIDLIRDIPVKEVK